MRLLKRYTMITQDKEAVTAVAVQRKHDQSNQSVKVPFAVASFQTLGVFGWTRLVPDKPSVDNNVPVFHVCARVAVC